MFEFALGCFPYLPHMSLCSFVARSSLHVRRAVAQRLSRVSFLYYRMNQSRPLLSNFLHVLSTSATRSTR